MEDPTSRAEFRRRSERGGISIREAVALLAIALVIVAAVTAGLEAAGFDTVEWIRGQFGIGD